MGQHHFLLSLMLVLVLSNASGQSTINAGNSGLKKGFYKNYQEFIDNAPSITDEFTVIPVYQNKKDPLTLVGGIYQLADSLKDLHHIWGFCDGNSIYVNSSPSFAVKYYWKLISIGKYPFFRGKSNSKSVPGITVASGLAFLGSQIIRFQPKNLSIFIINEKGKFREPGIADMEKILSVRPELLEPFKKAADKFAKFDNANSEEFESDEDYENKLNIIAEYLIKLNEALKK